VDENSLPGTARWRAWSGDGLEHLVLSRKADYIEAESAVISGPVHAGFAARYSLRVDCEWRTSEMRASIVGASTSVYLRRTEDGHWFDSNNQQLEYLDGIVDVDLSITPFTNSLPIRRLKLCVGESAEIAAAYVSFPELQVSLDRQRYTRVASDRYRYEPLDSDFVRELSVDQYGFVITYPGLFRRVEYNSPADRY